MCHSQTRIGVHFPTLYLFPFFSLVPFDVAFDRRTRPRISAATVFLWVSCVLAILITAGMFWLFLQNHMAGQHRHAATHFALCTVCGLMAPIFYGLWFRLTCRETTRKFRNEHGESPTFEDFCDAFLKGVCGMTYGDRPDLMSSVSHSVSSASSRWGTQDAVALLGALGRRGLALRRGGVREGSNLDEGVLMAERPSGYPTILTNIRGIGGCLINPEPHELKSYYSSGLKVELLATARGLGGFAGFHTSILMAGEEYFFSPTGIRCCSYPISHPSLLQAIRIGVGVSKVR
ncbi:unnamed protein product [Cladocopium goreaui]|uniref:Uncharacterized protein n=1 Tax=Cladocopium goreaui TaxID=2562237 RepID=A0A9P1G7I3_9DINO|nr:unnamed protein product [Cladocopium goreaui]